MHPPIPMGRRARNGNGPGPERQSKGAKESGGGVGRKVAKGGFRIRPTGNQVGEPWNNGHAE